jgi:outer membrane protein
MRRILFGLFISITALRATAQDVVQLSLDDCMRYALAHNYDMKNARLDVAIQDAQNKQTLSAAYPHINAHGEFDDYYVEQKTAFNTGSIGSSIIPFLEPLYTATGVPLPTSSGEGGAYQTIAITPQYSAFGQLSATQTLFDGSVLVALQARKTVMVLANQQADITEENLRYNIYKAYNALVIAYRQYDIIKSSLRYSRSIQHDLDVTRQAGLAEKIDVERTDVQVNNLATDSIRISNMLTVSEQVLKYQMGMNINTPIALIDTNLEEHKAEAMSLLEEETNYNRVPEFNLLNTQLSLNEYNVKRYQLSALPTVSVSANGGYNYAAPYLKSMFPFDEYFPYASVSLQVNVPIFNGFLRTNQLREAKLDVEKSENSIERMKQTIDFQAAQSHTTLSNALLQAQSQRRNLDLADDVLDLAERKYKAGVGSNLEVSQAQTDQLNAQNNYFSSLLDIINAEADLKKALGLLK